MCINNPTSYMRNSRLRYIHILLYEYISLCNIKHMFYVQNVSQTGMRLLCYISTLHLHNMACLRYVYIVYIYFNIIIPKVYRKPFLLFVCNMLLICLRFGSNITIWRGQCGSGRARSVVYNDM